MRVSSREQAIDIMQETFLRLWSTMEQGKRIEKVRPFLFTVAHRLIIDWYRKKKGLSLEDLQSEDAAEPFELVDESRGTDIEMASEGRFLISAIKKISPSGGQAVYLRYVEGLSPPEIGEIMGISANAASVRVNRGLAELRKITGYEDTEIEEDDQQN